MVTTQKTWHTPTLDVEGRVIASLAEAAGSIVGARLRLRQKLHHTDRPSHTDLATVDHLRTASYAITYDTKQSHTWSRAYSYA